MKQENFCCLATNVCRRDTPISVIGKTALKKMLLGDIETFRIIEFQLCAIKIDLDAVQNTVSISRTIYAPTTPHAVLQYYEKRKQHTPTIALSNSASLIWITRQELIFCVTPQHL